MEIKHRIQERIARGTAGMTVEQEIEHARRAGEAFRAEAIRRPGYGKGDFKAIFEALEQERRGSL